LSNHLKRLEARAAVVHDPNDKLAAEKERHYEAIADKQRQKSQATSGNNEDEWWSAHNGVTLTEIIDSEKEVASNIASAPKATTE
jgi:hypothetical protein